MFRIEINWSARLVGRNLDCDCDAAIVADADDANDVWIEIDDVDDCDDDVERDDDVIESMTGLCCDDNWFDEIDVKLGYVWLPLENEDPEYSLYSDSLSWQWNESIGDCWSARKSDSIEVSKSGADVDVLVDEGDEDNDDGDGDNVEAGGVVFEVGPQTVQKSSG